jgi:hypothetical protein
MVGDRRLHGVDVPIALEAVGDVPHCTGAGEVLGGPDAHGRYPVRPSLVPTVIAGPEIPDHALSVIVHIVVRMDHRRHQFLGVGKGRIVAHRRIDQAGRILIVVIVTLVRAGEYPEARLGRLHRIGTGIGLGVAPVLFVASIGQGRLGKGRVEHGCAVMAPFPAVRAASLVGAIAVPPPKVVGATR